MCFCQIGNCLMYYVIYLQYTFSMVHHLSGEGIDNTFSDNCILTCETAKYRVLID